MKKQLRFILLETEGCRNERNALFVILNEVKNLRESIGYKAEILRLSPQNDITTQSPKRGGYSSPCDKGRFGAAVHGCHKGLEVSTCYGARRWGYESFCRQHRCMDYFDTVNKQSSILDSGY